jgi:hypothetical protein
MKTSPIKSIFLIKQSIVLGAAVLTAASLLSPSTGAAADPTYLMPTGRGGGQPDDGIQPFDPAPNYTFTRQFMTYGKDSDTTDVPKKTLTITNNTDKTVYPIIRDPNNPPYDPYDDTNKEYRGYIGHKQGGKYYFGLKEGESIQVSVPLVFWNGGRISVGTDGQYLTRSGLPASYDSNAQRSITDAETGGVVMWYRAQTPVDPVSDSEDQLAEFTIRDHYYLGNPKITNRVTEKGYGKIPDGEVVTLMNYNVSNVDNLYLPLAMEANDVWVLSAEGARTGWKDGKNPDVYGWTGAINSKAELQDAIHEFTADKNELLGKYFGGKGWPFYNIPSSITDSKADRKIPSGANIFVEGPLRDARSSYNNLVYKLSSGGTEPVMETISSSGDQSNLENNQVRLAPSEPQSKIELVQANQIATANPPGAIANGTTVTAIDRGTRVVTLSKPLVANIVGSSITFTRPVDDYAGDAMIKLWYSWAQYYLAHWKDRTPSAPTAPTDILGSIKQTLATLSFNEAHPELVEGMAVTGPGLDTAQTEKDRHQGDAVILKIASDKKSVILSQVANTDSTDKPFTFHPPQPFCTGGNKKGCLLWAPTAEGDPGYPLIGDQFEFSNEPDCTAANRNSAECRHDPYDFSQQVYLIMASMNQIGNYNNNSLSKFMQDIVGANMGFIFTNGAKNTGDAQMVIAMIRDMIKSVLRGVSDFTKFPDIVDDHGKHLSWYPDPKEPHGGQPFNVFNLNPFVWFVHVRLGFSSYGFSVDDDTGNIGAGGASQLQVTVTGTGGLKNKNQWTNQAPYGPVKNVSCMYSGRASDTNGDTNYDLIKNVSNTTPIKITTVGQHHLQNGATVLINQVTGAAGRAANGTFKINNVTSYTFELFDAATGKTPIASSGEYIPKPPAETPGQWGYPLHPFVDTGADLTKVFHRVKPDQPDGTFLGAFVSVNGVDRNKDGKKFRVFRQGKQNVGRLLLDADLTDADGVPLPAGTYEFTFFGIPEKLIASGGGPPFRLAAIRDDIHDEMVRIQERLEGLEKRHSDMKNSARVRRVEWLELRIDVLRARLQYPTDEVLQQLEQSVEARKSVGPQARRNFRQELNRRLGQLGSGG